VFILGRALGRCPIPTYTQTRHAGSPHMLMAPRLPIGDAQLENVPVPTQVSQPRRSAVNGTAPFFAKPFRHY
jgi:hypothetical protein